MLNRLGEPLLNVTQIILVTTTVSAAAKTPTLVTFIRSLVVFNTPTKLSVLIPSRSPYRCRPPENAAPVKRTFATESSYVDAKATRVDGCLRWVTAVRTNLTHFRCGCQLMTSSHWQICTCCKA